ncbi:MAG: dihydrofolate reductase [Mameliella sp.]|nr:dihydrofolate reductase [Mameliella sp.]
MITLIAAHDRNRAIGKNGEIPWSVPGDMAMFKRHTIGAACIMGRKTWESLVNRPLPDRLNIVVSRDKSLHEHVVGSVEEGIALARSLKYNHVCGIGGHDIYKAMLPLADLVLLTEVDLEVEGADTWFPELGSEWVDVGSVPIFDDGVAVTLRQFER